MPKTLELQYLVEAETKLAAMEERFRARLPDAPTKTETTEYWDLSAYIERLKAEVKK